MSRNIPPEISKRLKIRDYFRCIWCGTHLYDRHHIIEFHLGGQHTLENLCLLCPNCHRRVHRGEIDPLDLLNRYSTQKKGDRLNGMLNLGIEGHPTFYLGTTQIEGFNILLTHRSKHLLKYKLADDGELLLSYQMFDKLGNLVFWMSDNSFWSTIDYRISNEHGNLRIENLEDGQYLQFTSEGINGLRVMAFSYVGGERFLLTKDRMDLCQINMKNISFVGFNKASVFLNI